MTAAAIPAAIVPTRPAWRSLIWVVPLALLWNTADLLATDHLGQRRSDHGRTADDLCAYRGRFVA